MLVTKDTSCLRLMTEERDQQRSKLYKAEKVLRGKTKRVQTVDDVQEYLNRIQTKKVLQNRFGHHLEKKVNVKDGRGTSGKGSGIPYHENKY